MTSQTLSATEFQKSTLDRRRTYELWRKAEREWQALKEATPNWDSLTIAGQRRLWHEHVNALYPDVPGEHRTFACETCHDGGFLYPAINAKPDYSTTIPCPKCKQWTTEERKRHLAYAGIPVARQSETLLNFHDAPGVMPAFESACELGEGRSEWKLLLLYGGHGNGKTHLARGALMAAADRGVHGRYYTVRQLMSVLREAMDLKLQQSRSVDAIITIIKGLPFLVIDELGTEDPKSDWQAGVLEDMINFRHDNMLETVLVTNKDITELLPGIVSRLRDSKDCKRVLNEAPDYRPKK